MSTSATSRDVPAGPTPEIVESHPGRVARAPSDVLRLVVAASALAVTVVLGAVFGRQLVDFAAELLGGLSALTDPVITALAIVGQVLFFVLIVGGLVVAVVRRRWFLIGSSVVASVVAAVAAELLGLATDTTADAVADVSDRATIVLSASDGAGIAIITAVVTTAAPWVSRRWRRWAWGLVFLEAFVSFISGPVGFDTLVGLLAGWTAGALVVVVLGAPSLRPAGAAIAAGLASVGTPVVHLEQASVDARGSTPFFAEAADGSRLFVKALGEDERSADLLFRIYRRMQRHQLGDERPFSSLRRAVEHEALVALEAGRIGVRTPRLKAFATAEPNGYVLAYEAIAGKSLDRLTPEQITDDVLADVWTELAVLRRHRVADRDLRLANVFLADDGRAWIIDFGFSEIAASDLLLATDLAELLASSTTQVGADRAVAVGLAAVGPDALVTALARLRLPMLSGATRTALKASPGMLDDLRSRLQAPALGA